MYGGYGGRLEMVMEWLCYEMTRCLCEIYGCRLAFSSFLTKWIVIVGISRSLPATDIKHAHAETRRTVGCCMHACNYAAYLCLFTWDPHQWKVAATSFTKQTNKEKKKRNLLTNKQKGRHGRQSDAGVPHGPGLEFGTWGLLFGLAWI